MADESQPDSGEILSALRKLENMAKADKCTHCSPLLRGGSGHVTYCPREPVCQCGDPVYIVSGDRCSACGWTVADGAADTAAAEPVDMIGEPPHYKSATGLQAIDVIEAFNLGFHLGNVVKYILRSGRKGNALEDLKKARWYLERHIGSLKSGPGSDE